jgi:hypothetical protein
MRPDHCFFLYFSFAHAGFWPASQRERIGTKQSILKTAFLLKNIVWNGIFCASGSHLL